MSLKEVVEILKTSELDRETKLEIIDIISSSHDQQMLDDLMELLVAWDKADNEEEANFSKKLLAINQAFEVRKQKIDTTALKAENQIAQDLEVTQKIQQIKSQLLS
ncbi:MAG: hypothetical protein V1664_00800 [Candidatus Uhrbacteria bacterium]